MSGGGGGGNSQPKPTNTTMPMDTVQPAMPGQLDAISHQLASGYGQSPTDIMSQLMQYYAPMQLPDYSPQPAPNSNSHTNAEANARTEAPQNWRDHREQYRRGLHPTWRFEIG
jgi:hypothetical protein